MRQGRSGLPESEPGSAARRKVVRRPMTITPEFASGSDAARCLVAGAEALRLPLEATAKSALLLYLGELRRWNARFNLTSVTDPVDMVKRHLLDSMSVLREVEAVGGPIVDLGTGAGLPGIVLALFRPERQVFMVDSVAKKTRFVVHSLGALGLRNAQAVHARCEHLSLPRPAALTVARAAAAPERILAWSAPLLKPAGRCLVMTGQAPGDLPSVPQVPGWRWSWRPLAVPGLASRGLLVADRER